MRSLVKGPVGGGVYAMRPIESSELGDDYFPAAVAAAVQAGAHKLLIPQGVYNFNPPVKGTDGPAHWLITDVTDLEIDGQGSVLNFTEPRQGILIEPTNSNVARVRLRNFTVDWPNLPIASLGTIVEGPNGQNNLQIDSKYPVDGSTQIQAVNVWDAARNTWGFSSSEIYYIGSGAPDPPAYIGSQTFSSPTFNAFNVGTRILARYHIYEGWAVAALASDDIDIESVHILSGPGMGFFCTGVGNRGFRLAYSSVRRAPGRLISTGSDGIHITDLQGDIQIENNEIAYQGDDALNINAGYYPVASPNANQLVVPGYEYPNVGDALAFFDGNFAFLDTANIQSVGVADASGNYPVTLDHAVSGLDANSVSTNLSEESSARYVVENNNFHDHRERGTLVRTIYGLVNHNTYSNNTAGAIMAGIEPGEGPGATDLIIANNTVSASGELATVLGAVRVLSTADEMNVSTAPIDQKIVISNNAVSNVPGPAFFVGSATGVNLFGNSIAGSNQNSPAWTINYGAVPTTDSTVVYGASAVGICGTQTSGSSTGPLGFDTVTSPGVTVDASGCSASPIVGYLDGFDTDDYGNTTVNGWACASQWPNSVMVQIYADGPMGGGGTFLNVGMANRASSSDIAQACQATGAHYFTVVVPRGLQKKLTGSAVYVYGLSPVGPVDAAIGNSGNLNLPDPTGAIAGHIEGLFTDAGGNNYVTGWACAYGLPDSIGVHLYGGGPAGSGQFVDAYVANLPSEPDVNSACGDSTNAPHRFMIPLDEALQDGFAGQAIYLHGISPDGSQPNYLIQGSGAFLATDGPLNPQIARPNSRKPAAVPTAKPHPAPEFWKRNSPAGSR